MKMILDRAVIQLQLQKDVVKWHRLCSQKTLATILWGVICLQTSGPKQTQRLQWDSRYCQGPERLSGGVQARLEEASMGEKCFYSYFHARGMWTQVFCPEESLKLGHQWLLPIRQHRKGQVLSLIHPDEGLGSDWSHFWGTREPEGQKNEAEQTDQLPSELSRGGPGWNSGACTPSQLAPSPVGIAPKNLLALSDVFFFFLLFQVVEVYTRKLLGWSWLFFHHRAGRCLPLFLVWGLVAPSAFGLCGTERWGAPGAATTVHSNTYAVVTVNFLLSLNHLNSACIILLLFM